MNQLTTILIINHSFFLQFQVKHSPLSASKKWKFGLTSDLETPQSIAMSIFHCFLT